MARRGTVGRSLLGEVHILDEQGGEAPPTTGHDLLRRRLRVRTATVDKTAAAHDPLNGWTTLGDVGYLDEDGFLYLTDRKAYMIITGGVNVYPQEAENVLAMHPKVADVAVFGIPHDEFGEEVKAVVEPLSMDDAGPELEASSSPTPGAPGGSSAPEAWISAPSCRAIPPASSTKRPAQGRRVLEGAGETRII